MKPLSPDPAERICFKNWYASKRAAKAALRRHQDFTHTFKGCRAYRCEACYGYHLGHLPAAVVAGRRTRADVFIRRAAA